MTALITPEGLARLDAALAWIDAHPEQHDQGMWFVRNECGTTMCLAGVVAHLAGAEPIWDLACDATSRVSPPGRAPEGVSGYARNLLGIDDDTTSRLFYEADDRAGLGEIRDRLAASLDGGS